MGKIISSQPKKCLTKLAGNKAIYGNQLRRIYQDKILEKAPILPKPLDYSDIDSAFFTFVENVIDLSVDGKLVPTYTLFSNQRFSEYSQMWEHSDENGNLYLNFKTVNREKNPSFGTNQGELWNIPGKRMYKMFQRDVLEDNGTESTEIYSIRQPYAVDLSYTINFVSTTVDNLNKFNQKINKIFASRQYYIRPNGHYIPMVIDNISDETSYSINDRKFYVQSVTIKVMAYIFGEDDFEVKKYPKRINTLLEGDNFRKKDKTCVEVEEYGEEMENKTINVNITFQPFTNKTEFVFDTEMDVENIVTKNVRNVRVMVNDDLLYTEKGFKLNEGDEVKVQVKQIDINLESFVQFVGYDPNEFYNSQIVMEKVSDEPITHEDINIEN